MNLKIVFTLLAGIVCFLPVSAEAGQSSETHASAADTSRASETIAREDVNIADRKSSDPDTDIILDDTQASAAKDTLPPIEKMPVLIKASEPEYPAALRKNGIEGTILLAIIINEKGTVDSVSLLKGFHPICDSLLMEAARHFVFTPAVSSGRPVPVLIQYEKNFSIADVARQITPYVNFSGRLLERGTREALSDAMVTLAFPDTTADESLPIPFSRYIHHIGSFKGQFLEENRLVAMTDSAGGFCFYSLPRGPVEVTIAIPGCEIVSQREIILHGQEVRVTYYIKRISVADYEIVVYGKAKEEKEVSHRQITMNEVKKIAGFGGDAVKVVQALPGVARPIFGLSDIVVRGSNQYDSKFYIDGMEIPVLFHYGQKSTYNSDALESVNFYPGGFGTRFGDAIGGVIDITGRKAKTDRVHASVDGNFFDGTLFLEGPVNKSKSVTVLGTTRRSFIGDLISAAANNAPDNVAVISGAPYYWDYIARIDADFSPKIHSYLTCFGVKEGFKIVTSNNAGGSPDIDAVANQLKYETLFTMGILGLDWSFSNALKNTLRSCLLYGKQENSFQGRNKSNINYKALMLKDEFRYVPGPKTAWFAGFDITAIPINIDIAFITQTNTVSKTISDFHYGDIAAYLFCEYKPLDNIQIIPGLRYDYYRELHHSGAILPAFWDYKDFNNESGISGEPSLRLNTRYEFIKNHAVKGSFGTYNQTPKPRVQVLSGSLGGNPDLPASRAAQYVLGYEWRITDLVSLDVQGYYNRQWRLPRSRQTTSASEYPTVGDGKKYATGLEIMLKHDQNKHFFGWLTYSLSRCKEYDYSLDKYVLFDKDQTHNAILVGTFFLPYGWDVGLKVQYTSGDPQTPIIGAVYNESAHRFEAVLGEKNSDRLPPTFQTDLRFDKKFILKKWTLSVYLDFFNIGYLLYKSPQIIIPNGEIPYDYKKGSANTQYIYQYSIPSFGIRGEF